MLSVKAFLDVCLVTKRFHPEYSGAAIRFQRYAPGLIRRGVQLRILTCISDTIPADILFKPTDSISMPFLSFGYFLPVDTVNDISVQRIALLAKSSKKRRIVYNTALAHYCLQTNKKPDVLHFLTLSLWDIPWLLRFRRHEIPMVYSYTLPGLLARSPYKRWMQRVMRRLPLQLMDWVIASTEVAAQKLIDLGVSTPIEVIPNGVDLHCYRPPHDSQVREHIRTDLNIPSDTKVIMTAGPIIPRKGIDLLVESWGKICHDQPDSWLLLVGPRTDKTYPSLKQFRRRLEDLVKATGASDRIVFTGHVSNMEDFLQVADIFVFPSHREGMGNVVMEAMACSLPVILTPFLGLSHELGTPDEQYLLSPPNVEALSVAIEGLLLDRRQRRELGARARRWVEDKLDVETSLDEYAKLYRKLPVRSL